MQSSKKTRVPSDRRSFIGGSDTRVIMGADLDALIRLWREKRGAAEPEDLSNNLIVQLGVVTEQVSRKWFERNTGRAVKDDQKRIQHPVIRWMGGQPGRNGRGGPPLFFTSGGSVCAIGGPDRGRRPRTQSRIAQGPFGLPSRLLRKPGAFVFQSRPPWKDRGPQRAPVQIASNPKARGQLYTGPESFSTIFVDSSVFAG